MPGLLAASTTAHAEPAGLDSPSAMSTGRVVALVIAVAAIIWAGYEVRASSHQVCVEGTGQMTRDGWDGDCYRYERRAGPDAGVVLILGGVAVLALVVALKPDGHSSPS